jgi:hypothetical protein
VELAIAVSEMKEGEGSAMSADDEVGDFDGSCVEVTGGGVPDLALSNFFSIIINCTYSACGKANRMADITTALNIFKTFCALPVPSDF